MNQPSRPHPIEHGTDVDEQPPREEESVGATPHLPDEDLRNEEPSQEANGLRRTPAEPA